MGNDGTDWTSEYFQIGDFPQFKIYDSSENIFYNAEPINIVNTEHPEDIYSGW